MASHARAAGCLWCTAHALLYAAPATCCQLLRSPCAGCTAGPPPRLVLMLMQRVPTAAASHVLAQLLAAMPPPQCAASNKGPACWASCYHAGASAPLPVLLLLLPLPLLLHPLASAEGATRPGSARQSTAAQAAACDMGQQRCGAGHPRSPR